MICSILNTKVYVLLKYFNRKDSIVVRYIWDHEQLDFTSQKYPLRNKVHCLEAYV